MENPPNRSKRRRSPRPSRPEAESGSPRTDGAARALNRLEELAEDIGKAMADAIREQVPAVSGVALIDPGFPARLDRHCRDHVMDFVAAVRSQRPLSETEPAFVRDFGTRRPREVFPLAPMLRAMRVGQRVLWEAVLSETSPNAPGHATAVDLAGRLIDWGDAASLAVEQSYIDRRRAVSHGGELARQTFFEDTLSARLYAGDDATGRAAAVGFTADADYVVAAVGAGPGSALSALEVLRARFERGLLADGRPPFVVVRREEVVVVAVQQMSQFSEMVRSIATEVAVKLGVRVVAGVGGPCRGLVEVPRAFESALLALRHARDVGGVVVLDEVRIFDYLLSSADPTALRLSDQRARPLCVEDARRGGTLMETFDAYLDSDLNVVRTAEALGLHPNTVRHRLAKIEGLTGLDIRRLADIIELAAVLGLTRPRARKNNER